MAETILSWKRYLCFVMVCWLILISFTPCTLSNAFLPVYNSAHNVSTIWTGLILGGPTASLVFVCLTSPIIIHKVPSRFLFTGSMVLLFLILVALGMLHYAADTTYYKYLALLTVLPIGVGSGLAQVTGFVSLTSLFPRHLSTTTAIGELMINSANAMGPFVGSFLYSTLGFTYAYVIPGAAILLSAVAIAWHIPQVIARDHKENEISGKELLRNVANLWVLFPAWHCTVCMILFSFPTPQLSLYVEEEFGKGVVWSGSVLLAATASLASSSLIWGWFIDRFSPFPAVIFSSLAVPATYVFIGPCPPLAPSKGQLFAALCVLGAVLPSGCLSALSTMMEAYRVRHNTGSHLPAQVSSCLVAVYCASYPLGISLGFNLSGIVFRYLSFPQATSLLAGVFLLETTACLGYCVAFRVMKRRSGVAQQEKERSGESREE